jgi:hypothetical protein
VERRPPHRPEAEACAASARSPLHWLPDRLAAQPALPLAPARDRQRRGLGPHRHRGHSAPRARRLARRGRHGRLARRLARRGRHDRLSRRLARRGRHDRSSHRRSCRATALVPPSPHQAARGSGSPDRLTAPPRHDSTRPAHPAPVRRSCPNCRTLFGFRFPMTQIEPVSPMGILRPDAEHCSAVGRRRASAARGCGPGDTGQSREHRM